MKHKMMIAAIGMAGVLLLSGCGTEIGRGSSRAKEKVREFSLDEFDNYSKWSQMGNESGTLISQGEDGMNGDYYHTLSGMSAYSSGKIVIGDSRCVQLGLYEEACGYDDFAVFAVWGGHYNEWCDYRILDDENFSDIRACFEEQVRQTGKCKIYMFATINDYDYIGSANEGNIDIAVDAAKRLSEMSTTYMGKEVCPDIRVIGFAGCDEEDGLYGIPGYTYNGLIDDFNSRLSDKLGEAGFYGFMTVADIVGSAGFISDGLHYDEETVKGLIGYIGG